MNSRMESKWTFYEGPWRFSLPEKEKTDMVLMLKGMRAPIMRLALTIPVTLVTTLASSRHQL